MLLNITQNIWGSGTPITVKRVTDKKGDFEDKSSHDNKLVNKIYYAQNITRGIERIFSFTFLKDGFPNFVKN